MSIDVLQEKIRSMKNPVMVGLDPYLPILPRHIVRDALEEHGQTPRGAAAAYTRFCTELLDALLGVVPAVKLQSACFEALGADGIAAMQTLSRYATDQGFYVLIDSMRGDVGSVAEIYAQAMFGTVPIGSTAHRLYSCNALTVNGYLGSDGVRPFLPYCKHDEKSIFLLLKTSNKSSREVQDLLSGDRVVYQVMADLAMRWSTGLFGANGYSEIGIAVGATNRQVLETLRRKYDRLFFLVPGYGAQGAGAKDAQFAFDRMGHGAAILAGRSILYAYQKQDGDGQDYQQAALAAAEKMKKQILSYITVM